VGIIKAMYFLIRALLVFRLSLAAENVALRQQLSVYKQSVKRPKLRPRDRIFWVLLSRLWSDWRSALAIVQPETVIKWHRQGFKLFWRWKLRAGKRGPSGSNSEIVFRILPQLACAFIAGPQFTYSPRCGTPGV
jgi:hypothetical protein